VARPCGEPCADIGTDFRGTDFRVGRRGRGSGPSDPAPDEEDGHDQDQDEASPTQQQRQEWIQVQQRRRLQRTTIGSASCGFCAVGRVAGSRGGDTRCDRANGGRRGPKSEFRGPRTGQLDGNEASR
jgi:hypothetical protein